MRDGVLTPGSLLPSQRELASTFGVARSSLRQARNVLETMGGVNQKVGDDTCRNNRIDVVRQPVGAGRKNRRSLSLVH